MCYTDIVEADLAILSNPDNVTDSEKVRMKKTLGHLNRQIIYFHAEKQHRMPPTDFPLLSLKEAKEELFRLHPTFRTCDADALVLILITEMENEGRMQPVDLRKVSRILFELKNLADISKNNRRLSP